MSMGGLLVPLWGGVIWSATHLHKSHMPHILAIR